MREQVKYLVGLTAALPLTLASLAASAADSETIKAIADSFQPVPAVTAGAPVEVAQVQTSTSAQPRFYYYPSYRYQPTTGQIIRTTTTQQPVIRTVPVAQPTVQPVVRRVATPAPTVRRLESELRGYLALRGAYTKPHDFDFAPGATAEPGEGFAVLGAIGSTVVTSPSARTRVELEGGYRENDIESLSGIPIADGDYTIYTGMLNAYQDIGLGRLRPYIGVGAGVAYVDFESSAIDETWGLGLQGMLGLEVEVVENLSLTLEARRFMIYDAEFDVLGVENSDTVQQDEVSLGVKFNF